MPTPPNAPVSLFRNRAFLSILGIGALQSVSRWLELLALGVYVWDLTQSEFSVALITLLRVAPLALFGSLFGALTDRFPKRGIYVFGLLSMIAVSLGMAWLASAGKATFLLLCLSSFAGGLFWVLDFTVRRNLLSEAVPNIQLGRAMGFDTIFNNGTRMLGPLLGGAFLQFAGLYGAFLVSALFYVGCLAVTLTLTLGRTKGKPRELGVLADMKEGLRVVASSRILSAVLLVTVVYNLFGFPTLSMVPVLGRDELNLSASVVGAVASMEGAGAMLGGLLIVLFGQVSRFRHIYVFGLGLAHVFAGIYASLNHALPIGFALLIVGIGASGFAAMQTTLLVLNSNLKDRGRMLGLLSVCVGTALLGYIQIGLVASWQGPRFAVIASSIVGICCLFLIYLKWPEILARQPTPSDSTSETDEPT